MQFPYSISYHNVLGKKKESYSILSSFLSQTQSKSSITQKKQTTPQRMNQTPSQLQKKQEIISPRAKLITVYDNRKQESKPSERMKFLSEHTLKNVPYLCVTRKKKEIKLPILKTLTPEPKSEIPRIIGFNMITEPTAPIEEKSEELKSIEEKNFEQLSIDQQQQFEFSPINRLIYVETPHQNEQTKQFEEFIEMKTSNSSSQNLSKHKFQKNKIQTKPSIEIIPPLQFQSQDEVLESNDSQSIPRVPPRLEHLETLQTISQHTVSDCLIDSANNLDKMILLEVPEVKEEDPSISNSKISLKTRFRQAVQRSFRKPPRKSIFNLLISPEFNQAHQAERMSLSAKTDEANQILAKFFHHSVKQQKTKLTFLTKKNFKNISKYVDTEQFNVSTKAFQRKINLIHGATSRNIISQENFSLLPKFFRKSVLENKEQSKTKITNDSEQGQQKISISICYEGMEQKKMLFSKPKYIQDDIKIEQDPQESLASASSPIKDIPTIPIQVFSSINISKRMSQTPKATPNVMNFSQIVPLASTKKLGFNSSFIVAKEKRISRVSIMAIQEEQKKIDPNNEYFKARLFVRVYYQNKLYKLMQKTNYTKDNLLEIDQGFKPKIVISTNITQMSGFITLASTITDPIRQRRQTLDQFDRIQMLTIKQSIYLVKAILHFFNYDDGTSSHNTSSSEDSEHQNSFDTYLEAVETVQSIYQDQPQSESVDRSKELNKSKRSNDFKDFKDLRLTPIFINDAQMDYKQLCHGLLVIIKKVRKAFQTQIFLSPIISILEQSTKNKLLSFEIHIQDSQPVDIIKKDELWKFTLKIEKIQNNAYLRRMNQQSIQIKYEEILIGRYESQTRMIDFEHQDQPITNSLIDKKDTKHEKSDLLNTLKLSTQNSQQDTIKEIESKHIAPVISNKIQKTSRVLTKQDSLNVNHPQQWNRRAMNSGYQSNAQTLQQTNQQNSHLFTQTSTILVTKPTQTSQLSAFRAMSSKHIDLNNSQQDISINSIQQDETPQSDKKQKTQQPPLQQQQSLQPQNQQSFIVQPQRLSAQNIDQMKSISRTRTSQNEESLKITTSKSADQGQDSKSTLGTSMLMFSLKMRTHIKEQQRREKLDQIDLIELAIQDNNIVEFMENIQILPEKLIDTSLENGNTFLIIATQCGCTDIVKELLRRGADINIQNDDGNTAVHLAMAYRHFHIADLLRDAGGNTKIFNKYGQSAWNML